MVTHFLGQYQLPGLNYLVIGADSMLTSLPQIYPILITNDLHLYGTKMFP